MRIWKGEGRAIPRFRQETVPKESSQPQPGYILPSDFLLGTRISSIVRLMTVV
jgi:hypothetical protein